MGFARIDAGMTTTPERTWQGTRAPKDERLGGSCFGNAIMGMTTSAGLPPSPKAVGGAEKGCETPVMPMTQKVYVNLRKFVKPYFFSSRNGH
jgi:hypothetical protein